MRAALILGTQLGAEHPAYTDADIDAFVFVESAPRFETLPYHRHKIVLILSGMRHAAARLEAQGRTVHRVMLDEDVSFARGLQRVVAEQGIEHLAWMSATDRGVDRRIARLCERLDVTTSQYDDELFFTPSGAVDEWFAEHPVPLMEDFYRWQRRRTGILMQGEKPAGGRWNFDADNRSPLPKQGVDVPALPSLEPDEITRQVMAEVNERFPRHPGDASQFWLPVEPDAARAWLRSFLVDRLENFGRYEDAMAPAEPFLFHSVLSPLLNTGMLPVAEVIEAATSFEGDVPISSLEGFVRQVIGWREYMRGMYRTYPPLAQVNALHHTRSLEDWWYTNEGVPDGVPVPVRTVLTRVHRFGYAHHIERLMVLGNWFLLEGYAPREVTNWFIALFVDGYEWVMVPNVMGMSQYADGGFVATKPYISGGAYLQRMGSWFANAREAKESPYTEGYWRFLDDHEDALAGNHRLAQPLAQMRKRRERESGEG